MSFISGMIDSIGGGKESKANEITSQAAAATSALAQQQAQTGKYLLERFKKAFVPVENKFIREAQTPTRKSAGYLGAVGQINRGYADNAANIRRESGGTYQYGSGLTDESMRSNELNRVRDLSKTYTAAESERVGRLGQVSALGRGLTNSSIAATGSGLAGSLGLGNLGLNMEKFAYGQNKDTASSLGDLAGSLAKMFVLM